MIVVVVVPRVGIIPANTGRIAFLGAPFSPLTDHPREYGENLPLRPQRFSFPGSSPRIRGEFGLTRPEIDFKGIIPANTGRIHGHADQPSQQGDHPREYGENGG